MEYLPNGELFDYVWKKQGLDEPEAREIFAQIAEGVHYCHMVRHPLTHANSKQRAVHFSTVYIRNSTATICHSI